MSSDAILSIVALIAPLMAVLCLVLPRTARRRARPRSRSDLGPSGAELIPSAPPRRRVEPEPAVLAPTVRIPASRSPTRGLGGAVSSSTLTAVRTRRSLDAAGAVGATGALVTAASSATAGLCGRALMSSTTRRYASVVDSTGRTRPRRRILVVAGVGAIVAAAVIAAR